LDEIAERLLRIQQLEEEERPKGIVEPLDPVSVTQARKLIILPSGEPWFSVQFVNDGPDAVNVIVNKKRSFNEHRMLLDETYKVDFGRPLIEDALVWCDPGETATVRIVGTR
jgi:hypothetical protein